MFGNQNSVSRRNVLKMAGASVATAAAGGLAAAKPGDTVEVNVGFSAESGRKATLDAASEVVREFEFDAATIRTTKAAAEELDARADVRYVEENGTMEALGETLPWGQDRIDSDVLHSNGELGSGADIAIIDTGIDDDHEDLTDHIGKGKAYVECGSGCQCSIGLYCTGGNNNDCNYAWSDDNNHGTHCAGIAAGDDNSVGVIGVAPDATLHAVKVLGESGCGSYSDIAAGIEYTADQGWDVGSMSLGGSDSSTVQDACQYAYDNGVLLVAAAGNDGECTDCVSYPAAYQEVVAVSATTPDDTLASYSSQGPEIELAAPGGANDGNDSTSIYSSVYGGYDYYNGTSMACPHVSGVGGQLMANGYTHKEARSQLQSTAEDIGLADNEQGYGLVDAAAALGYDSSDST